LIRPATVEDIPDTVRLRRLMFESMGFSDTAQLDAADAACKEYFARAIPAGRYQGWQAVTITGKVVASGGLVVDEHPPGPSNLGGRIGYIMNLYTDPAYRRQGLARQIFSRVMEWIRAEGITTAALHTTEVGRPLYAQSGFKDSNEMRTKV